MGNASHDPSPDPRSSALGWGDFSTLGESILSSLSVGVVAFDRDLRVVRANLRAGELLELGDYVDQSLAAGTDAKVWGGWSDFLKGTIDEDRQSDFTAVKYRRGDREKLLHIVLMPVEDSVAGAAAGGAMIVEDVTARVEAERQLAEAERLAAIGKVAGKVAHELNNPMDGILRYINLAFRVLDKGDSEKARDYLSESRAGLMRMVQIMGELLEFSRSTHHAFEFAAVDKIAADAVKAMDSSRGRVDIEIVQDCDRRIPAVKVMSLFQVFCNLIKNAADAMAGAGKLTISIRCPDEAVVIEFRDNGPGLVEADMERVFDAFYTTKGYGSGTGLGLSICRDIIEKYGGSIRAENAAGGGAVFTVRLPLSNKVIQRNHQR